MIWRFIMVETEYVLHLSNVEKHYGKNKILKGVNLSLQRGRIYGLIGQNGAGKTTIMRVIAGLVLPDSGSIQLFGEYEKIDFVRKNVGCIIESPTLYPNLTAMENLNIIRRLKNIEEDESLSDILSMLQINDTSKKVKNYSVGMKQKVGIAMALIGDPQLLILDEPLNGLDPIAIVRLRKYLQKLVEEKNVTILISSHILSELDKFASDFILIDSGEIKKVITKEELETDASTNKNLEEVYLDLLGEEQHSEVLNS